ncbi:MFS transporter [Fredinandcohnia humi]
MDYRKNVTRIYIIIFFHNLIPAYVIERIYWQDRGMTVMMVVLCEIVFAITIVISEIPTGIVADKFGRKKLLVLAGFLSMLEMIVLLFAYSFWTFAFAVFLAGIAGACVSGAMNALLYDSLAAGKQEDRFERIVGRINSIDFIAAILAALLGSVLGKRFGFEIPYILSAVSMFIAFVLTIFLHEPPREKLVHKTDVSKVRIKDYVIQSFSFYRSHPRLVSLLLQAMTVSAGITYLDEFWQLYLYETGYTILFFGVFSALISLARIPGNLLAARLLCYLKADTIVLLVLSMISVGFFMTAIFPGRIGVVVVICMFLASGVVEPVTVGYVHHRVSSSIRATVDSFQSLLERTISLFIGLGFGYIATKLSVVVGFAFLGAVSFLILGWYIVKSHPIKT